MVQTRSQLENLSKDKLIDDAHSLKNFKNSINAKFSVLNDRFNNFQAKLSLRENQIYSWSHLQTYIYGSH